MGVSDESAILSKWLVRGGDRVCKGQPVFSLETDKATFQYEAESDGFLVRILTGEGEEAAVGSPVGILSDTGDFEGTELEALLNGTDAAGKGVEARGEAETGKTEPLEPAAAPDSVHVRPAPSPARRISPRAKKKADELGLDLNLMQSGSGPEGRIIERDVWNADRAFSGNGSVRKTRGIYPGRQLTQDDRVNARRMPEGRTGQTGFASRLVDARKILAQCTPRNGLTPGAAVCRELAQLLVRMPGMNIRRHGDRIYEYQTVHLRLTVETPRGTLKPVIRCAEAYTADELAALMRNAAERCRVFASKPQEFQEGTFTVADLSGYGTDFFTPELTPPELCALGIGAVTMQAKTGRQGGHEVYPAIRLTLAYDRAGADALRAAVFLNELAVRLEPGGTEP